MSQTLHNAHYALLNKDSGLYLAEPSSYRQDAHLILKDPDFSQRKDEVFQLENLTTNSNGHYKFNIRSNNGNFYIVSNSTGRMLKIENGATVLANTNLTTWTMYQHSHGPNKGFSQLREDQFSKYLDIGNTQDNNGNDFAHLSTQNNRPSQFWRLVPIPHPHGSPVQIHTALLRAQNEFRYDFRDQSASPARSADGVSKYSAASVVSSGPYTGPNICRNPTCGIDHICDADYYRRLPAKLAGNDPEEPIP
ncbi:hypothetical protein B0O99DRAFT_695077 [Bisporella sp. PMI_857]|nr:hypothetical protein B0O99DRAFT_695077 [Bisporella sp. PMI_857]